MIEIMENNISKVTLIGFDANVVFDIRSEITPE
jgi:hypothetical protein